MHANLKILRKVRKNLGGCTTVRPWVLETLVLWYFCTGVGAGGAEGASAAAGTEVSVAAAAATPTAAAAATAAEAAEAAEAAAAAGLEHK